MTATSSTLRATTCAICGTIGHATQIYPARLGPEDFNPTIFSARRNPDRVHYRVVRCNGCGLVRSDPTVDPAVLSSLYAESAFDYGREAPNLVRTYGHYLARAEAHTCARQSLLEVGCGNGFFLEEALRQGYRSVVGIEPSAAAVDRASPKIRRSIVCDVLRPGLLGQEQFDLICVFQVLDHVPDPAAFIDLCNGLLRPGGCLLVLNHNVESLSARLLCARSPIIDVQHTYLYSRATLAALCEGHGLVVRESANAWNCCSLDYLVHLLPIPELVKRRAKEFLRRSRLATATAWLPLGNLYAIAQKPSWRAL